MKSITPRIFIERIDDMEEKPIYVSPEILIVKISAEDVLTSSALETPGVNFPKSNKL